MHTDKYIRLQSRLGKLRKVYLPKVFSPTGLYSDSTYEKVRAYKVLAHAEMEYYFEEVALSIARKSYVKWNSGNKTSTPLLSMVAYYEGSFSAPPNTHDANNADKDLNWRINTAYTNYNKMIRSNNHGIKEKNILGIFLPIGVKISDIDESMLLALENFGSERGMIAHSTRTSTLITPDDALDSVNDLMTYIGAFDQFLAEYKKTVR
ncbi:MAG: hypothetical protein IJ412_06835 [Oscillospiraceae bacterium]|nr:hypothetical protein [Oscillospiraceae bacterium]